jgi:CDP-diacylglycerol--glycerol-3-phosphate 3-phosphatidyltransferase
MIFTTPNLLTLGRIAMVPLIVYLLFFTGPTAAIITALVFLAAIATDFLDGYVARNYGSGTNLGKFLDPLADKLVVMAALIMLAAMPRNPHVPPWMVVVLVSREFIITALRAIAAVEGHIIAADELGKYKMVLQYIAVEGLLIHYTWLHVDFFAAGLFVLWLSIGMSLWSGVDYIIKARTIFSARPQPAVVKRVAVS